MVDPVASAVNDHSPSIVNLEGGAFMVAWTRGDPWVTGEKSRIVTSTTANWGEDWSSETVLATTYQVNEGWPLLARNGSGVVLVFSSTRGPNTSQGQADYEDFEIYARVYGPTGSWGTRMLLSPSPGSGPIEDDLTTRAALAWGGAAGHHVVVWSAKHTVLGGADMDLWMSRSTNDGLTWSLPVVLHESMAWMTETEEDGPPALATDGAGRWRVTWARSQPGATEWSVHTATSTGSTVWSTPVQVAATTAAVADLAPALATDGTGTWVTAWATPHPTLVAAPNAGTDEDIAFMWEQGDGAWMGPLWLDSWATTDPGADRRPTLATGGAGEWVGAWETKTVPPSWAVTTWDIATAASGAVWDCDDGDPDSFDWCDPADGCQHD
jgi:hypothetical protein